MSESETITYHPDGSITNPALGTGPLPRELYDRLWDALRAGKVYEEVWRNNESDLLRQREVLQAAQMAVMSGPVYETLTTESERNVHMWESTREARLAVATASEALQQATADLSCHREETANLRALAYLAAAIRE